MSIVRTHKSRDYTVMSNHHLNNPELTLKAKGLLSFMLSKPDEWDFSVMGLKSQLKEGRDAIAGAMQELIDSGYIIREQNQKDNGTFNGTTYHVYEKPMSGEPISENPISDTTTQVNTDSSKDVNEVTTEQRENYNKKIESIYYAYPTKCPTKGRSTGKSPVRDKAHIRRSLKKYGITADQLLEITQNYVKEAKINGTWIPNFSKFLNGLPDAEEANAEIPFTQEAKMIVESGDLYGSGVKNVCKNLTGKSEAQVTAEYKRSLEAGENGSQEERDAYIIKLIKERYSL